MTLCCVMATATVRITKNAWFHQSLLPTWRRTRAGFALAATPRFIPIPTRSPSPCTHPWFLAQSVIRIQILRGFRAAVLLLSITGGGIILVASSSARTALLGLHYLAFYSGCRWNSYSFRYGPASGDHGKGSEVVKPNFPYSKESTASREMTTGLRRRQLKSSWSLQDCSGAKFPFVSGLSVEHVAMPLRGEGAS